jgi:mRNA-degrading endonuclease RelE of RelBE toxin-antitoxin system
MEFVETPLFTREVSRLLTDDSYRALQQVLLLRPEHGDVLRGSGGLRKLRWGEEGRGKRGGLRVIYYWDPPHDTIYMLWLYRKTEQEDLPPERLKVLRELMKEELR